MGEVYNRSEQQGLRRELRADAPPAEQRLWHRLRGRQLGGLKFRRQYGVGPYALDFCCPEAKLGVEIDGPSHYDEGAEQRDAARTAFIAQHRIRLVRFTNQEVYEDLELVLERILRLASGAEPDDE